MSMRREQPTRNNDSGLTVFAGTFNPVHTGHLIVAESIRCELNCERILFIPSYVPPCKNNNLAEFKHRFNMVKLATEDNPHFEVSDIESRLEGISYTINTINELYRQNPSYEGKINFIIGADAFNNIETWYEYEKLVKVLKFIVVARPGSKITKELDYKFSEAPEVDISSSGIRNKINENKSIKYLVPALVERYIIDNRLYI